jgi:hypothetical protein
MGERETEKKEKAQTSFPGKGCDDCAFNLQVLALPAKVALDLDQGLIAAYNMAPGRGMSRIKIFFQLGDFSIAPSILCRRSSRFLDLKAPLVCSRMAMPSWKIRW